MKKKCFYFCCVFIFSLFPSQTGINTDKPLSTLDVNGSIGSSIVTASGSLDLTAANYYTVIYTGGSSIPTFTLPDPTLCKGRIYRLVNAASSTNYHAITLSRPIFIYSGRSVNKIEISMYTTNGGLSDSTIQNTAVIQSDGTNWWRIGL